MCGCGLNKMSHLVELKVNFSSVLELFGDGKVKLPLIYETVSTLQKCNIYVGWEGFLTICFKFNSNILLCFPVFFSCFVCSWHDYLLILWHIRCFAAPPNSIQGSSRLPRLGALPSSVGHIPSEPQPGCRWARSQTSCHWGRHAPRETGPGPCQPSPYSAHSWLYGHIMYWTYGHDSYPPKVMLMWENRQSNLKIKIRGDETRVSKD